MCFSILPTFLDNRRRLADATCGGVRNGGSLRYDSPNDVLMVTDVDGWCHGEAYQCKRLHSQEIRKASA